MKNIKIIAGSVAVALSLGAVGGSMLTKSFEERAVQKEREERALNEMEAQVSEEKIREDVQNAERMVNSISKDVDIIVFKVDGVDTHSLGNGRKGWFKKELNVETSYEATIQVPMNSITFTNAQGVVEIKYDLRAFEVKLQEVKQAYDKDSGWLVSNYPEEDTTALENVAKEDIKNNIKNNNEYFVESIGNLKDYFLSIADDFGVDNIRFTER